MTRGWRICASRASARGCTSITRRRFTGRGARRNPRRRAPGGRWSATGRRNGRGSSRWRMERINRMERRGTGRTASTLLRGLKKRWASRRGPGGTRRGSGRTPALSPGTRSTRRVDFDGSPNRPSSRFAPRASPRRPRRRRRSPPRRSWAYRTTESRRPGRKASTKFHERRPRGRRRNARVTWLASDPSSRSLGATSTRWPGSGRTG